MRVLSTLLSALVVTMAPVAASTLTMNSPLGRSLGLSQPEKPDSSGSAHFTIESTKMSTPYLESESEHISKVPKPAQQKAVESPTVEYSADNHGKGPSLSEAPYASDNIGDSQNNKETSTNLHTPAFLIVRSPVCWPNKPFPNHRSPASSIPLDPDNDIASHSFASSVKKLINARLPYTDKPGELLLYRLPTRLLSWTIVVLGGVSYFTFGDLLVPMCVVTGVQLAKYGNAHPGKELIEADAPPHINANAQSSRDAVSRSNAREAVVRGLQVVQAATVLPLLFSTIPYIIISGLLLIAGGFVLDRVASRSDMPLAIFLDTVIKGLNALYGMAHSEARDMKTSIRRFGDMLGWALGALIYQASCFIARRRVPPREKTHIKALERIARVVKKPSFMQEVWKLVKEAAINEWNTWKYFGWFE